MRANAKKFSRVLIPLVLAAFGLVLAMLILGSELPVTPVSAQGTAVVTATLATDKRTYCYGEYITVTATITNEGPGSASQVTGTLSVLTGGDATPVSGPAPSAFGDPGIDLSEDEFETVVWVYQCTGDANPTFELELWGDNVYQATVQVTATQNKPHLEVEITAPTTSDEPCPCDDFDLTFWITNTGTCTATHVSYAIDTSGNVSNKGSATGGDFTLGPDEGEEVDLTDRLHCDGAGPSTVTVDPSGEGENGLVIPGGPGGNLDGESVPFTQAGPVLEVSIDYPTSTDEFCPCDDIQLTLTVTNTGDCAATNVVAAFTATGSASGAGTVDFLTVAGKQSKSLTVLSALHCDGPGAAGVGVSVTGKDGADNDIGPVTDSVSFTQNGPQLTVDITEPLCPGEACPCDEFPVKFTIKNTGKCDASDLDYTIDPGDHAEVVICGVGQGQGVAKMFVDLGDLKVNESKEFSPTLHCTSPGTTTITVTPSGKDGADNDITDLVSDMAEVYQGGPHLVAEIIEPCEGCDVDVCSDFPLVFQISNQGECAAYGVTAEIDPELGAEVLGCGDGVPKTTPYLGTLEPGEVINQTYTMHCLSANGTGIVVTPAGYSDPDWDYSIVPKHAISDTVTFEQVGPDLTVTVDAPDSVYCSQEYEVEVTVTNNGNADAEDVMVMIDPGDKAEWVWGGDPDQSGHPQTIDCLNPGESETLTWKLHCTGEGLTTVTAKARCDGCCYGWAEGSDTVDQRDLDLDVQVDVPPSVYVGEQFEVVATITNMGDIDATNVVARLPVGAGFKWISGGTGLSHHKQYLDRLQPDEEWTVVWVVECTEDGYTEIWVEATSDHSCGNWYYEFGTVDQLWPELHVNIIHPETSSVMVVHQNFPVIAEIESFGGNPDVLALIDWAPDGAEWVTGGWAAAPHAISLGDMSHGEIRLVEWTLRCTDVGDLEIFVGAESQWAVGEDWVTVHQKMPLHPALSAKLKASHYKAFPGQTFSVIGWVCNEGEEPAIDVNATLEILSGDAAFVDGEDAYKYLGDIPGSFDEPVCYEAKWTLVCTGLEDAVIKMTAEGDDDVTGEPLDPAVATVVMEQYPREDIKVTIIDIEEVGSKGLCTGVPGVVTEDDTKIGTCTLYLVKALIENTGYANLTDVYADIDWAGHVTLQPGGSYDVDGYIYVGDLSQHGDVIVEWKFHCSQGANNLGEDYLYLVPFTVNVGGSSTVCTQDVTDDDEIIILQKDLVVEITAPENLDTFNEYQHFEVWARVCNRYDEVLDPLDVTIEFPSGGAHQVGDATQPIGHLDQCMCTDVFWEVICDSPGATDIRVTASGLSTPSSDYIDNRDEITVIQQTKAHLVAVITSPDMWECFGMFNVYPVEATITNTGQATATNVEGFLYVWAGAASIVGGPTYPAGWDGVLEEGESVDVTWYLHCDGVPCDVYIEVAPEGDDVNTELAILWHNLEEDYVWVQQLPLIVDLYQYPGEPVETSTTFGISAAITNIADTGTCPGKCEITDVTAILHIDGPASLVRNEQYTKTIGTVSMGTTSHAEWTVHCDRQGDVDFWVEVVSNHCANTVSIFSNEVTVTQVPSLIRYDIPLAKDWNVMSLPLIPPDTDIEEVLASIEGMYTEVWYCSDGCDEVADWHIYWVGHPGATDLFTMEDGLGYYIRMIYPDRLIGQGYSHCEVVGADSSPPEYALEKRWNMVGFTTCDFNDDREITQAADTMTAVHYLASLDINYDSDIVGEEARFVRYYEPGFGWVQLADGDDMWVGKGYFLYASEEDLYIVPPITQ